MSNVKEAKVRLMPSRHQAKLEEALHGLKATSDGATQHRVVRAAPKTNEKSNEKQVVPAENDAEVMQRVYLIPTESIELGACQLRQSCDNEELANLATSIKSRGLVHPILVRPIDGSSDAKRYEVVAGERRLRASRLAGLKEVPALVREVEDREALELAIIENAQREDLNPVDQALSLRRLGDRFDVNQTEIARIVGKNRATVSNTIRLLQLAPEVQELLSSGELSAGHGRALLMLEDEEDQVKLARKAISRALSVRALESLVSRMLEVEEEEEESEDEYTQRVAVEKLEKRVSKMLNIDSLRMNVDSQGRKRLSITFPSEASWKRFVARIRE